MERFYKIDRTVETITKYFSYVSGIVAFLIAVIVTINIITTKLFNWSIPSCNDWVAYLFCIMFYFAIPFVRLSTGLVSVDILTNKFPKTVNNMITVFSDVLGFVLHGMIGYYSISLLQKNIKYHVTSSTAKGNFELWPFNLIIVVFSILFSLTMLWHIVRTFVDSGKRNIDDPKHVFSMDARVPEVSQQKIEEDRRK